MSHLTSIAAVARNGVIGADGDMVWNIPEDFKHFKRTTGITQKNFQMIRRAQEAVRRLKQGEAPAGVAADLGYSDQPHMIKSIKAIMGHLPSDLELVHKL